MLGSQKLTALRDKIYCISEHLEGIYFLCLSSQFRTEKSDTSSYFFIDNTFYNDLRLETSRDLSKYYLKFINFLNNKRDIINNQEKKIKNKVLEQDQTVEPIETFESKDMEDCKFEDLTIVIGKPYLYRHQNACDHLLIFNNVR